MAEAHDKELINFIATTVETMRDQMATKDDLVRMATTIETLREQMATKEDLTPFATKEDLAVLREEMATKADIAAVRADVERVQVRLDSIDRAVNARTGSVETEVSRLRSVIYLLVKDKPEMLRLLGQPTLGESRA